MSKNINDWEAIFAQYEASNLSQRNFCKKEGLSWNQFRYQLDRKSLLKPVPEKSLTPEKVSFEAVSIISSSESKEVVNNEVSIYLPNHIRCDIKLNYETHQFTALLKQLVALC